LLLLLLLLLPLLQSDIGEFTKLGGLTAVEERLVGVQDIEAKLEELGKRAELYQVQADTGFGGAPPLLWLLL
jgi:hypothetical protein